MPTCGILSGMTTAIRQKTSWHVDGRTLGMRFITYLSARTMRSAETIDWHRHEPNLFDFRCSTV